jgi:hypothetical protein
MGCFNFYSKTDSIFSSVSYGPQQLRLQNMVAIFATAKYKVIYNPKDETLHSQ